jgi:CubicO group peptidase (beta-lactamase class C family)
MIAPIAGPIAQDRDSRDARSRSERASRSALRTIAAAVSWTAVVAAALLTALLLDWVLLGIALVGSGPAPGGQPVPLLLLALLAVAGGLAMVTARYIASWRAVGCAIAVMLTLISLVGVTWVLSAADQALYFAQEMAWDGPGVLDYRKYPQRPIANAPHAFHFQQSLAPQIFKSIQYRHRGQMKQGNLEEFLKATQTTSFIIIKDGSILHEGYASGYNRDSIVASFSIAKSFTSALIGIAIDEGYIGSVDDPMVSYLPELRGRGLDGVTLRHLLSMSAGIRYAHEDEQWPLGLLPFNDDARSTNFPDLRRLALSVRPGTDAPGSTFEYNDFVPLFLGMILERTTHRPVAQYLQEKIWQPLGMEYPASWSLDSRQSGFEKMAMGLNARAIDFAKLGVLFLDHGRWGGKQVVPEKWVEESTSPDASDNRRWRRATAWKQAHGYYKYLWWGRARPDGSYAFMARGNLQQQWVYVSPRDRVVIVRFGLVDGAADSWPDIFESVTDSVRASLPNRGVDSLTPSQSPD